MVQQRFQIIVLRKLRELQENTDNSSQSGKTHEQNEKFNKETETIKKEPKRRAEEHSEVKIHQ